MSYRMVEISPPTDKPLLPAGKTSQQQLAIRDTPIAIPILDTHFVK